MDSLYGRSVGEVFSCRPHDEIERLYKIWLKQTHRKIKPYHDPLDIAFRILLRIYDNLKNRFKDHSRSGGFRSMGKDYIDEELQKAFQNIKKKNMHEDRSRFDFYNFIWYWRGCLGRERVFFLHPFQTKIISCSRESFSLTLVRETQRRGRFEVIMHAGTKTMKGWVREEYFDRYLKWKRSTSLYKAYSLENG